MDEVFSARRAARLSDGELDANPGAKGSISPESVQLRDFRAILVRGAGSAVVVHAAGAGIGFALHVLLSRLMGAEHYGVYVYVLSWITVLALFGKLGLDTAVLRFVAAYNARQEWSPLAGILKRGLALTLVMTLAISMLGTFTVITLGSRLSSELVWTFLAGFGLLPLLTLANLRQAALRALRRITRANLPDIVLRQVFLGLFMLVAVYVLGLPATGPVAMGLDALAMLVAFSVGSLWLYRAIPGEVLRTSPEYRTREWVGVALPLFFLSGILVVHSQVDILMVGSILGNRDAGIYAVAAKVSHFVPFGLVAVNAIAAPTISELYATERKEELQRMVSLAARGILAVTLPVALGLLILGEWVLSLFGPNFLEGYAALAIMIFGQLINSLAGPVGFLMTMTGHERQAAAIIGLSLVVNLTLNALLIPRFGLEGAAAATAMTLVLWNGLMLLYVIRRLGVNSTAIRQAW